MATRTLASQRQRGDGGDPVGVSSRSSPIEVSAVQPDDRVVPGHPAGGGQRARTHVQPPGQELGRRGGGHQRQGDGQQQPAHRMAGPAAGHHRPHRRRADHGHDREGGVGGELDQVGPAGLAQQPVQPGDRGQQASTAAATAPRPARPARRGVALLAPAGPPGPRPSSPAPRLRSRRPAPPGSGPVSRASVTGPLRDQRCTVPGRAPRAFSSSRLGRPSQSPGTVTAKAPQAAAVARRSGTGRPARVSAR